MEKFDQDVLHWKDYDYVVINDNLEICFKNILNVIEDYKNNKKIEFDRNHIESHIKYLLK